MSGCACKDRRSRIASVRARIIIGSALGAAFFSMGITAFAARPQSHAASSRAAAHRSTASRQPVAEKKAVLVPGDAEWFGIYFGDQKIGYSGALTDPTTYGGRPAVRVETQTFMRIKLLGAEVSQDVDESELYRQDGSPIRSDFRTRSAGHENHVSATYTPTAVFYTVGKGTPTRLPIPKGVKLGSSSDFAVDAKWLRTGAKWSEYYFDPATLRIEKFTGNVTGRTTVHTASGAVPAWSIQGQTEMSPVTLSVDSRGKVLSADLPLGIRMISEPRSTARQAADYHPTADLAEVGAVPIIGKLDNPRLIRRLHLTLSGTPANVVIPSGPGQMATPDGDGRWRLTVTSTPIPASGNQLPEAAPRIALAATPDLPAQNPEIRGAAHTIVGSETDSVRAVRLLHDWVNLHMRARYDIGVIRSGIDVLHNREGVCRDYAVLYASLARAAGIPTRICAGLVCARNKFYYHAWDESYVGAWVRVDPTMPGEFVDATHITLARGNEQAMMSAVPVMGRIRIEVTGEEVQ